MMIFQVSYEVINHRSKLAKRYKLLFKAPISCSSKLLQALTYNLLYKVFCKVCTLNYLHAATEVH